jgi:hypothetical protein
VRTRPRTSAFAGVGAIAARLKGIKRRRLLVIGMFDRVPVTALMATINSLVNHVPLIKSSRCVRVDERKKKKNGAQI